MDGWNSEDWQLLAGFVVALLVLKILQPIWTRSVGWHFSLRQHRWLRPALIIPAVPAGVLLFNGYQTVGLVLVILGGGFLAFLHIVVGARCPECRQRLRLLRSGQYGPARYSCPSCDFYWSSHDGPAPTE